MKYSEKLYRKASQKFREADYDGALEDIENAITSLRKTVIHSRNRDSDDFKRFVDAKILQGKIYHTLGLEEALDELLDSLKSLMIGSGVDSDYAKGKVNYFNFEILSDKGETEESLKYLLKAKDAFIESENYQDAIEILFDLQDYSEFSIDPDKLMDLYKEILDVNKKLSDKNSRKINSGRTRLQIAKVLRRTDGKKSRKSLVVAYNELVDSKGLYLESLYYLAEAYLRQQPEKATDVVEKIRESTDADYHMIRTKLIEGSVSLIEEQVSLDWTQLLGEISKIDLNLEFADNLLDLVRYMVIYGDESVHATAFQFIEVAKGVYDDYNDRLGKSISYFYEGLVCDISEADNKLNLVEIYSKPIKDDKVSCLRSLSLDLIHWIDASDGQDEIRSQIKDHYNNNDLLQAETLALIGMYYDRKNSEQGKDFIKYASDLFSSTKMKNHVNLEKLKISVET